MLAIQSGAAWNSITPVEQLIREFDLAGNVVRETNTGIIQRQLVALGANDGGACESVPNPPPLGAGCLANFSHEIVRLPNGFTAALASIEKIFPPGTQGNTSPLPVDIIGNRVVVLDTNWQVVWYWDSFKPDDGGAQLEINRRAPLNEVCVSSQNFCGPVFLVSSATAPQANEWLHGNSIYYEPATGDLLISLRDQDWVIKVDYNNGAGSGKVLWRLGLDGDFTFKNIYNDPYPWFSHQHDGIENGGSGPLTVFDNGNTRVAAPPIGLGSGNSRGMALTLDQNNM